MQRKNKVEVLYEEPNMTSMPRVLTVSVCSLLMAFMALPVSAVPETFQIDPDHSMILFRVKHARVSYTYGRFNSPEGTFMIDDANPDGNTFQIQVATANVYTGNRARDYHLTSPDFFNARQFRVISFQSSSVTQTADKQYEITGKLSPVGLEVRSWWLVRRSRIPR